MSLVKTGEDAVMSYTIEVIKGNIVTVDTEAIVNAANNKFWMGSGVAGAIKAAGGESIEQEAMLKGPVMPGEVVATTAGQLRYKYVIHAAVMGQDLRTTERYIRQATVRSSQPGRESFGLEVNRVPGFLGPASGGFPMAGCANIMVLAAKGFRTESKALERVVFCLFDELGYQAFRKVADKPG